MTNNKEILSYKIGFIGGGNMCKAIVKGLITNNIYPASQIYINGPHPDKLKSSIELNGCNIINKLSELVERSDVIILSIKPNVLNSIVSNLNHILLNNDGTCTYKLSFDNKIIISVLAGVTLDTLNNKLSFPSYNWYIIRVMPNTPLMVGAGNVIYCTNSKSDSESNNQLIEVLFGSCSGICLKIPEYQMNGATSITGCGPAFIYLIIDALADGGVKQGINKELSIKLAAQTLLGASQMVLKTGLHPILLKDQVCSPAGTTIVGIHELEKGSIRNTLINAVEASTNKANQLDLINK